MAQPRLGIYPGTFDPITNGHIDIIGRATRIVDKLIIAVAANPGKAPLFSLQERCDMLKEQVALMRNGDGSSIEVRPFSELLMHFVEELGATIILRGLRAVSDFEYEFQMAGMNTRLNPRVETVFLMASERQQFIASRFVKEVALLGGDVSSFVPTEVVKRIARKLAQQEPLRLTR
jgi:pantetheine-phosphate adenylyltransferase